MRTTVKLAMVALGIALSAAQTFRGSEVKTYQTFQYGRFETRVKAVWAAGTVQSFFLYFDGPNWSEAQWNEIDVEIVPSAAPNGFSRNLIYGNGQQKLQDQGYLGLPGGQLDAWHTYAIEWTPDRISWIVDGQNYLTLDTSHESVRLMNKAQKLMMNVWSPTFAPWGDNWDPSRLPVIVQYDYVKVWSYNWGNKGFDYMWEDQFDNFDYSRWQKSNMWTFDGNRVTFSWDNVFTMNGVLNMRLDWWPHASKNAEDQTEVQAILVQ